MVELILIGVLFVIVMYEFFIIKGFLTVEKQDGTKNKNLTGREIEEIRRKLVSVGVQAITAHDVLNIILTIRNTQLGTYIDKDPWFPADPYEDVEDK